MVNVLTSHSVPSFGWLVHSAIKISAIAVYFNGADGGGRADWRLYYNKNLEIALYVYLLDSVI